jgi:hypothetical protein
MNLPLTGGCLCGAIRYTVAAPITELRVCHCRDCQKSTGTGGSVNAMLKSADFRITQGTPKRYTMTADSGRVLHRFFCGECGTTLLSRRELTPENTSLRIGTLDAEHAGGMRIVANIWTGSARSWSYIDPATQRVAGQPDAPTRK